MNKLFLWIIFLSVLPACENINAWDRGILAKSFMATDPNPGNTQIKQHVYFSKEGATGGGSIGGGGCGCN